MNNVLKFQQMANQRIIDSINEKATFIGTLGNAFSAVSTTFKTINSGMNSLYMVASETEMEQMNSLMKCGARMDAQNDRDTLLAQMQANELRKAMEESNA
jgi:hypothetical protein